MSTMRAYVINLRRSPERRISITAQLTTHGIDYEIVEAVDGRELDLTDPQVIGTIAPSFRAVDWFPPTLAACAMSHLSAYRKVLDANLPWALIMEDDVTIPADLRVIAEAVAAQATGAEIVLLNFDSDQVCQVSRRGAADLPSGHKLVLPVDVHVPVSAAAYVITREACERITAGALPIRAKNDEWGHFHDEGMIDRLRCVVPLAVVKDPNFGSTIDYYPADSIKARTLKFASRLNLHVLERVVARRRERIWRKYTRVEFVDEPVVATAPLAEGRVPAADEPQR
jgi:glycosyl transferase family 25